MRRRQLLLGAVVLALPGLAVAGLPLLIPRHGPGITRDNYERIREGMTLSEVESLMGEPSIGSLGTAHRHRPSTPGPALKAG
jgi:hypothetical protein